MKYKTQKIAYTLAATVFLAGCGPEFSNPVEDADSNYSKGSADFTKFVALGDSLTAGYADGALYLKGQQNSFPSILAQQFALVGGGEFTQPLVSDNTGGLLLGGNNMAPTITNRLVLGVSTGELKPELLTGTPTTEVMLALTGPFNNMGVPGAKSFHAGAAGYGIRDAGALAGGLANPYFARFSSSDTASMIGDAAGQQPSFFLLWLGNNDVLSYATSGGAGVDQTGNTDPATYAKNDITDPNVFAGTYASLVAAMKGAGGKGVVANIPDVTTIPYFTTVPYNAIPLDDATAGALNAAYAAYNGGLQAAVSVIGEEEVTKRTITFAAGQNAVVIEDDSLTDLTAMSLPSMRQASAADLVVLPAASKIGTEAVEGNPATKWGVGVPLEDGDVLTESEIALVATAREAYNATILAVASADSDLLHFDVSSVMTGLDASGIDFGTGLITADFATGGGFSLDGVHPTARGYAVIANAIIDQINTGFSANIPKVDPGAYTTVFYQE